MSSAFNYFQMFQLEPRFSLDQARLEDHYRQVQLQLHPDKFVGRTDAERRVALQWSTQINEAYRVLKNPIARALYLCQINGVDTDLQTTGSLSPVFLQQQLEWREQLEEAKSLGKTADLKHIKSVLNEATQQLIFNLSELIDRQGDFKAAAQRVREGMFIDKFSHELDLVKDKLS